jgi:4-hydroxybenzoate polyprenyltransferase
MFSRISLYVRSLRSLELLLMIGSPLLGVLFADPLAVNDSNAILRLFIFLTGVFALGGHVYSYNSWAGLKADQNDKNKQDTAPVTGEIKAPELLTLSVTLLVFSTVLLAVLDIKLAALGIGEAFLWFLYCNQHFLLKARPILGSLIHIVTGEINFLLGYLFASSFYLRGALIGLFFALLFTGGHLNHELRDFEADRDNGYKTNAVTWGKYRAFLAAIGVFTVAHIYFIVLGLYGFIDFELVIPATAVYPAYLVLAIYTLKKGISFEYMDKFRTKYRIFYGALGLYMLLYLLCSASFITWL